jgi:hypothetical protein
MIKDILRLGTHLNQKACTKETLSTANLPKRVARSTRKIAEGKKTKTKNAGYYYHTDVLFTTPT